ncbi:MAG: hypothetical protein ACF8R7_07855 [Phycisphaerales bacterium JB039]
MGAGSLPSADVVQRAIAIYLDAAYPSPAPAEVTARLPEAPIDVARWLGGDAVEREPPGAGLAEARSFAVRLGNSVYPHMKLRMARPPRHDGLVFSVDAHDQFLAARAEAEAGPLEQMKRHNAEIARVIHEHWERAGVPTERSYLRAKVAQARREAPGNGR